MTWESQSNNPWSVIESYSRMELLHGSHGFKVAELRDVPFSSEIQKLNLVSHYWIVTSLKGVEWHSKPVPLHFSIPPFYLFITISVSVSKTYAFRYTLDLLCARRELTFSHQTTYISPSYCTRLDCAYIANNDVVIPSPIPKNCEYLIYLRAWQNLTLQLWLFIHRLL